MSSSLVIACDPGASGAFCVLDSKAIIIDLFDMPSISVKVGKSERNRVSASLVYTRLKPLRGYIKLAVLEKVGGMTGQSASAAFTFGSASGIVEGVYAGLEFPVALVTPQQWKKDMKLISADKGLARQMAIRMWPSEAHMFARVKNSDRAEAALMAKWGLESLK